MSSAAQPPAEESVSSAAKVVHALLARHGVDRRRYVITVADVLGLSRTAAHQRVNGSAAWLWEDLERMGRYYGETMLDMVSGVSAQTTAAQIEIDKLQAPVQVRLGEGKPDLGDLWAAYRNADGRLIVMPIDRVPYSSEAIKVTELIHGQEVRIPLRVAVLDDAVDTAASVADMLRNQGCDTKAYSSSSALLADVESGRKFDAFVLDWCLGNTTAEKLIAELREKSRHARIVLLTGEMGDGGKADSKEIVQAQNRYHFFVSQKPADPPGVLMANLTLEL